ncbi:MAG TPA: tRNA (adenosine(37)-N6)-threonylcarbamoyltransferase complex ATPase subunit type 1 TsaE, partial [Gaiellaceae bacterium]|nr:tRNA (adenosine(37)-N6)-threonylcarbamoyltransferase complex ATPase subunit type 1 TsaE [Gaiellaceae bacterium]
TQSVRETVHLGRRIGELLRPGQVVALIGELGSGKTHLVKGLAAGVGVRRADRVASPSFTLIHEYHGRIPFYHVDLYRLAAEEEAAGLGFEEYLGGAGVTAIEWADRIPSLLPRELLWVRLRFLDRHGRLIDLQGKGRRYKEMVALLEAQFREDET